MIITAKPVRAVDLDAFTDLTGVGVTGVRWAEDGSLEVTFASDLTPVEAAAVRRRMVSRNLNEEELRRLAELALVNNRTYLLPPAPTAAQVAAQVAALTRQNNGIIRMLLGLLDGTD